MGHCNVFIISPIGMAGCVREMGDEGCVKLGCTEFRRIYGFRRVHLCPNSLPACKKSILTATAQRNGQMISQSIYKAPKPAKGRKMLWLGARATMPTNIRRLPLGGR